uniref:Uncharacterized protein n=1 Tax=Arundo donax TaxID=35708 RepID=A0A0A9HNI4_ARUDO
MNSISVSRINFCSTGLSDNN